MDWTHPRTILKIIMISRNMSDQSTEEKIKKWEAKKKSVNIIDVMSAKHTDAEVLQAGLAALAAISIGTEYMKTRVQHQLACEVL